MYEEHYQLASLLSQQEEKVEIIANSLHPGSIITNLLRYHSFIDGKQIELHVFFLQYLIYWTCECLYLIHGSGHEYL